MTPNVSASSSLMSSLLVIATITTALLPNSVHGQQRPTQPGSGLGSGLGSYFTRRVPCTLAREVQGYNSLDDLNNDIRDYYDAFGGSGSSQQQQQVVLSLCPGRTFDTSQTPLRPILNNMFLMCGDTNVNIDINPCKLDGGNIQLLIDDPLGSSSSASRQPRSLDFYGITFQNFNGAILASASAPTIATFTNCIWRVSFCREARGDSENIATRLHSSLLSQSNLLMSSFLPNKHGTCVGF